jgi:membrane fusion protein, multidrug efflux system
MKNRYSVLAFLQRVWVLLVVIHLVSCSQKSIDNQGKIDPRKVPVIEVVSIDTTMHREYVADIEAVQNVELRARVQGFLEEILVDEGHYVSRGQVLFRTNNEEYKAELAKASANLESAIAEAKAIEYEVDRLRVLVEKNVIAETELNVALAKHNAVLAKIEEAKSARTNAEVLLSYTEVKAPFNGIIDRIPHKIGSLIDYGTLLTRVSDVSAVHVYFNVSEREYLEYVKAVPNSESNIVKLILADGSLYTDDGMIETMDGEFNANTGTIAFRARFSNSRRILKHGATGRILLSTKIKNALIVPQKAVFEIQDRNFVFVLDHENKVSMRSFYPKSRFSHYYIVESGLEAGDRLVYEGIQNLRDGMQVIPNLIAHDLIDSKTNIQ